MSAGQLTDAVERRANRVWGEAEPGSQMEMLAGAIRDLAVVVRPLIDAIDAIEANRESFDNLRQMVEDMDQRLGEAEQKVATLGSLPGTWSDG